MADISKVEEKVLDMFRRFNVGAGEVLPVNSIQIRVAEWTPPERRLYEQAVDNLVKKGLVERCEPGAPVIGGLRLTEEGEKIVYV